MCACVYLYVYVYTHARTHKYKHAHIHIYAHRLTYLLSGHNGRIFVEYKSEKNVDIHQIKDRFSSVFAAAYCSRIVCLFAMKGRIYLQPFCTYTYINLNHFSLSTCLFIFSSQNAAHAFLKIQSCLY